MKLTTFYFVKRLLITYLDSTTFIHDDFVRKPVNVDGLFEKGGSCGFISTFGKHEINSVFELIDNALQINPLAFDLNLGFIHPPGGCNGTFMFFGFCCNQWRIVYNPAIKGGMIHFNTTLFQYFFLDHGKIRHNGHRKKQRKVMSSFGKWTPLKLIIGFSIAKIGNYRAD